MLDDLLRVCVGWVGDDAEDRRVAHRCYQEEIAARADISATGFEPRGARRAWDRIGPATWVPNWRREGLDSKQTFAAPARLDVEIVACALKDMRVARPTCSWEFAAKYLLRHERFSR